MVGISGFLDFQPHLAAASLRQQGVQVDTAEIVLPELDVLRENPSEFRAVNIARLLDNESYWPQLYAALQPLGETCDALFMPACFGLTDNRLWRWLSARLPCTLGLLPTLPFRARHSSAYPASASVCRPWWRLDGRRRSEKSPVEGAVSDIWTRNHGDIPLRARYTVLASGSFFSNGLLSSRDGVREAILGLDVRQSASRADWYQSDFFTPQPRSSSA